MNAIPVYIGTDQQELGEEILGYLRDCGCEPVVMRSASDIERFSKSFNRCLIVHGNDVEIRQFQMLGQFGEQHVIYGNLPEDSRYVCAYLENLAWMVTPSFGTSVGQQFAKVIQKLRLGSTEELIAA
jgi:hypothetical protein